MSTAVQPPKPRPYRRFLTSALHARFVHAAVLSLLFCLITSFVLSTGKDLFWSWFPFGPAGLRALLFFMSNLFIFLLQIATLTVGRPTFRSRFNATRSILLNWSILQSALWYYISAWWFSEVYIWSAKDLGWITFGDVGKSDKLNEKPIYVRAFALMLATIQIGLHWYLGSSSLHLPVTKRSQQPGKIQNTHDENPILKRLQPKIVQAAIRSGAIAGGMALLGPILYTAFLRQTFWHVHLMIAKPFFNLSRSNAHATGFPQFGGIPMMIQSFFIGLLMLGSWELSSTLFLTYLDQEPIRKGILLSAGSKDPNATLVTGLKAKRDIVKTFAIWELAIIAQRYPERRKLIFEDIDRPTGPIWNQMLDACLEVISRVDLRIQGPPAPAPANSNQQPEITKLPKLIPETQSQQIFANMPLPTTRMQKVDAFVSASPLKTLGNSQNPWHPPVERAVKLLEYGKTTPAPEQATLVNQWMTSLQRSPFGWFFNTINAAKINAIILGSPNSNAAIIIDAAEAVTRILVASLAEDTFGTAKAGVPKAVRTLSKTITMIETYTERNSQAVTGGIEEVVTVHDRLKANLAELLSAFQMYLADVGLGIAELNQAKRAAEPKSLIPKPTNGSAGREGASSERSDLATKPQQSKQDGNQSRPQGQSRTQSQPQTQPQRRQISGNQNTKPSSQRQAQPQQRQPSHRSREMEQVRS